MVSKKRKKSKKNKKLKGFENLQIEQITEENSTGKLGLPFIVELMKSLNLMRYFYLGNTPKTRKQKYSRSNSLFALFLSFMMGGTCLKDVEILREDKGINLLDNIKKIPSDSTIRNHLTGEEAVKACQQIFHAISLKLVELSGCQKVGIHHDATYANCNKKFATYSYLKEGKQMSLLLLYYPEVGVFGEADLRPGHISPSTGILEQLKKSHKNLTRKRVKLDYFQSDSAGFQYKIINDCNKKNTIFYLSGISNSKLTQEAGYKKESEWIDLTPNKAKKNQKISDEFSDKDDKNGYTLHGVEVDNKIRDPDGRHRKLRTLVLRKTFYKNGVPDVKNIKHYIIYTNNFKVSVQKWFKKHNSRMGSENKYKEIKNDFSSLNLPSKDLNISTCYCFLSLTAFNVLSFIVKHVWRMPHQRAKSVRLWFIETSGRLVRHARKRICKIINASKKTGGLFMKTLKFVQGLSET